MKPKLVVSGTPEETAAALASYWRGVALEAHRRRGYFAAALSGGRTPAEFYRFLARENLPWGAAHLFQVDERFVPAGSPESNARLIREALLAHLQDPPGSVHLVDTGRADAFDAARAYEAGMLEFFGPRQEGLPAFDLVVLGLGTEGHTGSLFPASPALREEERLVVGVAAENGRLARVTLTLRAINHARAVAFLVAGEEKRAILARVLSGAEPDLPAALVRPREGVVTVFADRSAAPGG